MAIDKKELQSRLWTEWTNGLKLLDDARVLTAISRFPGAISTNTSFGLQEGKAVHLLKD